MSRLWYFFLCPRRERLYCKQRVTKPSRFSRACRLVVVAMTWFFAMETLSGPTDDSERTADKTSGPIHLEAEAFPSAKRNSRPSCKLDHRGIHTRLARRRWLRPRIAHEKARYSRSRAPRRRDRYRQDHAQRSPPRWM